MRIAVASGKGGAGKTSVTASLAYVWDSALIVVDADVEAPNLHLFLPPRIDVRQACALSVPLLIPDLCTHCEQCRDICAYKAIAAFAGKICLFPDMCHGCGGCFAVCPAGALQYGQRELGFLESGTVLDERVRFLMGRSRIGEAMTPPILRHEFIRLEEMLASAPTSTDVLIDAPPGVSCPVMTVARDVDMILLTADSTPFGFHDFRLAHQALLPLHKRVCVVINRAGLEGNAAGDAAVREYCAEHDLPLLGALPFERVAAEQYAKGGLLATLSPLWQQRFEDLRDGLKRIAGNGV